MVLYFLQYIQTQYHDLYISHLEQKQHLCNAATQRGHMIDPQITLKQTYYELFKSWLSLLQNAAIMIPFKTIVVRNVQMKRHVTAFMI